MLPEPVLHPVTQGALVSLKFYKKFPSVSSDYVDYILLHGHGVGGDYLARQLDFVQQQRDSLYLIAFFLTCLCRKCYSCVERIGRDYVWIATVLLDRTTLSFTVYADYFCATTFF